MIENRAIVWWLYVVALCVVATLIVGGATRITDSGLSITEWAPILGVVPPLSEAAWQEALAAYRLIPEYQLINRGMSLEEFKVIYWWEWGHRMLARFVGLVFVVPLAVFWLRGRLPEWFKPWGLALLALGGLQGFVGWWMVSSGLVDRVDVSQYRLAVHLTLACIILMLTVWLATRLAGLAGSLALPGAAALTARLLPFAILAQTALGALVAGMDAGLASNTWPLMMGSFVPPGVLGLEPAWINPFENPVTAQFNHRIGGYLVLALALVHVALVCRAGAGRGAGSAIAALVAIQAAGGIGLVVWQVPPLLAGLHQAGAAVTLWIAVVHATQARRAGEPVTHRAQSFATSGVHP